MKNLWLVLLLAFVPKAAAAEDLRLLGTLTRANSSVLKVMQRAGCHPAWLSQVVSDSGLGDKNLRRLDKGVKVYIRTRSCKTAPSAEVRQRSASLLKKEAGVDEVAKLQLQIRNLENELDGVKNELASLQGSSAEREKALQETAAERDRLQSALAAQAAVMREVRFGYVSLASVGVIGLCVGGLLAFFLVPPRTVKGMVNYPLREQVKYEGDAYHFEFVRIEKTEGGDIQPVYRHLGEPRCKDEPIYPRHFQRHAHRHFLSRKPEVSIEPARASSQTA